jgi:polysaccharide transporter, PST family
VARSPEGAGRAARLGSAEVRNVGWSLGERVATMAVQLLAGILVVRHLGPELYGTLAWSQALVWIAVPVVGLGLDEFVRREWAVNEVAVRGWALAWVSRVRALVALLVVVGLGSFALVTAPAGARTLTGLLLLTLLAQPLAGALVPLEVELRADVVARVRLAGTLLTAGVQVGSVLLGASLGWFYAAVGLGLVVQPVGLWVARRRLLPGGTTPPADVPRGRGALLLAAPFAIAATASAVTMRVDQLMLEAIRGVGDVGVYGAAVRISEVTYALPVALAAALYGATARGDTEVRAARLDTTFGVATAAAVVAGVALAAVAGPVVSLAFGSEFAGSVGVLRVHALTLVPVTWWYLRWQWLVLVGRPRLGAGAAVAGAACNVVANLVLVPVHGPVGAAWATLGAYLVETVGLALFVPGLRPTSVAMLRAFVSVPVTLRSLVRDGRTALRRDAGG